MAEWTNLFDLGECMVKVLADSQEYFSQVVAKGDSHSFDVGSPDTNPYTIAVSAEGEVSLMCDDDGNFHNNRFEVQVIPTYSHDFPARIRGAQFSGDAVEAFGAINLTDDGYVDYDSLSPASPEPLDLSAATGEREFVSVYARPGF